MISKLRIGVLVIILNFFASVATTWGQVENPSLLQMAVPSLNIAPDARGGGMGDMGAATLPDINSQYWNAAKYAFRCLFRNDFALYRNLCDGAFG